MVSLILPFADTSMMNLFLEHVSRTFSEYFLVMQVDQAGWHRAKDLIIPENVRLIPQPAYSPVLNRLTVEFAEWFPRGWYNTMSNERRMYWLMEWSGSIETKEEQMETIRSSDGTPIAYQRSGHGLPLIVVHGTGADHARWGPVLPALERSFTVYALDRRGRGKSGDTTPYALEQEFEDILAVIDSIPEPVFLLGHSYGAICCLEAARRTTHVRKLVLYEPPLHLDTEHYSPQVLSKLQILLDRGDREGALVTFQQEIVRVPPHELALLRSSPSWSARIAAAHTLLRELRGANAYVFEATRFRDLKTPTLLLLGEDSPAYFKTAIEAVHGALSESQVRIMAGQQHAAINTAPELFTREVVEFLTHAD